MAKTRRKSNPFPLDSNEFTNDGNNQGGLMPSAFSDNVAGHRSKYELLKANLPPEEVGKVFVGGSDPLWTGYSEIEMIRRFKDLEGATVVDIGCGIGRLTQHIIHEKVARYLGIDIIPEILQDAINIAEGDERFKFAVGENCTIPMEDGAADVVVAYSVITHLLDEEIYEYFLDARRVLKSGGVAIFSFLDFMYASHVDNFFKHASHHRHGHGDILKYTTKEILSLFADRAGFSGVEFIDGAEQLPTSELASPLVPQDRIPATFAVGQSSCIMRA